MNTGSSTAAAAALGYRPPPFTVAQWQELEHQALIFKYLMAGVPVPPDLLLPIRWSFDSVPASARFYPNPTLGYYSYFGKKFDPEPGRCRRTDGKKWRCSKDAYGDSKYCERHMHRGRNRSRKHVESHTLAQPQSSSTMATLTPTGTSGGISASFRAIPLQHSVVGGSNSQGASQLNLDTGLYGMGSKECRYPYKVKSEVDEHSFSEASGHVEDLKVDSALDSSWSLRPSRVSSFPLSKARSSSLLPGAYPQLHSVQDVGQVTISSLPKQQQHHSFLGINYGASSEGLKHESQSLRPFFDEWPKTRDSWLDLEDEKSNRTSFSTTRLSISIPMAASDFNTASRSPNDD